MIYYFTGTGNSLWCARAIAEVLDERTESIVCHQNERLVCDDDVIGFVMPTYMGDVPWLVKKVLLSANIPAESYTFVVMTSSGGSSGSAFASMDQAIASARGRLDAAFDLQMPGNCIVSSEEENGQRLDAAPAAVTGICEAIGKRRSNFQPTGRTAGPRFVENTFFYGNHSLKRLTMMKGFEVTDACTGCGACASICPRGNIRMEGGHAIHDDDCAACYACLHWCPTNATLLKVPTLKHRPQYHHPEITLDDMLVQNGRKPDMPDMPNMPNMEDATRRCALVTGASGGLGMEFARIFAEHGFDLVLVARNQGKLEAFARELEDVYGSHVEVIAADLSQPDGAEKVWREVHDRGIRVDQLVNNAGAGKQARTIDADPEVLRGLINLNAISVTLLCRYFGADMVQAGHGRILNVSSMGAFVPDPFFNVYGPTKAFELRLTEAMRGELAGTGVTVSALCPGPVKTNWAANAGKADSGMAKDANLIARIGYEGMQRGRLVIVPTLLYKTGRALMGLLPEVAKVDIIRRWQLSLIEGDGRSKLRLSSSTHQTTVESRS